MINTTKCTFGSQNPTRRFYPYTSQSILSIHPSTHIHTSPPNLTIPTQVAGGLLLRVRGAHPPEQGGSGDEGEGRRELHILSLWLAVCVSLVWVWGGIGSAVGGWMGRWVFDSSRCHRELSTATPQKKVPRRLSARRPSHSIDPSIDVIRAQGVFIGRRRQRGHRLGPHTLWGLMMMMTADFCGGHSKQHRTPPNDSIDPYKPRHRIHGSQTKNVPGASACSSAFVYCGMLTLL